MRVHNYNAGGAQSVRRSGAGLRRKLRSVPLGDVVLVRFEGFPPSEDVRDLDEALFELMVTLNCCSKKGPLPGKAIVLVVESDELKNAVTEGLDRLGRANLAMINSELVVLGAAFEDGAARDSYESLERLGGWGTSSDIAEGTSLSRQGVALALERLTDWGLVLALPEVVPSPTGPGRPAFRYYLTSHLLARRPSEMLQVS